MGNTDFGDVLTFLCWSAILVSVSLTPYGLIKKSSRLLFVSSLLMGFAAFISMWSIGKILIIIALFQLVMSIRFSKFYQ